VFQQIIKQKNSDENITDVVTPEALEAVSSLTSFSRETKKRLPPISKLVEEYHSDLTFLGSKFPNCSRELFEVNNLKHDTKMEEERQLLDQITNDDAPIENMHLNVVYKKQLKLGKMG